jgi:hypothetical protein
MGLGGNEGFSLNNSLRFMDWVIVSRVGVGGFHVRSAKNFGIGGIGGGYGRFRRRFKFLRCAFHYLLFNLSLAQRYVM